MTKHIWLKFGHDDVIKLEHFPRYWPFVQGIHRWLAFVRSFDAFFHMRLNIRLIKQSWGWWFETLSHPLWRHKWSANCLLSDGNESLAEPMLTNHQWSLVAFTWGQFHKKYLNELNIILNMFPCYLCTWLYQWLKYINYHEKYMNIVFTYSCSKVTR